MGTITFRDLVRSHGRAKATRDIESQLRAAFGALVHKAVIPHSVRVEEAHARHRTVLEFAPQSAPAVAYERLLAEVLRDGQSKGDPDDRIGAEESERFDDAA
jgi:cellulose biosynthesis protein BcsQ